jgi:predicted small lipoprotein YifL
MKKIFSVFIFSLFISGCGCQGALYLPRGASGEKLGPQSGKTLYGKEES